MWTRFWAALLVTSLCVSTAIAQNQPFVIGPAANPAAKLRAAEQAAAEKRLKEKQKREECKKRAVTDKIPLRDRKSFLLTCEKTKS
jgi:hypothetical protein